MTGQSVNEASQPLWREQAERWLTLAQADSPTHSFDPFHDDLDPDPPPAAPAMRPWPRVFPGL